MTQTISDARTIADEVVDELSPLIAGERSAFAGHCHERSISMAHLHLMTLLDSQGPMPMGRVAEALGSGLPTATGIVTRMEDRGLVERLRDQDDRRVVLVQLSTAGRDELSQLQAGRRRRIAAALEQLSDPERRALLKAIRGLRRAFHALDKI
ncbi:MAG TPA: MarR family transcriptional regulator [Candidatus Limnocylindrales bacterium]|nr:MarR family transcriptional regulator [Candidatus Limnocylindrales bacterium]